MTRHCARPGCTQAASATLTYDYAAGAAWIDRLAEPHPMAHDLCDRHAAGLTVPVGWRLEDRRVVLATLPRPDAIAS